MLRGMGPARGALIAILAVLALAAGAAPAVASVPLVWASPQLIDTEAPYGQGFDIASVSCPGTTLCVAFDSRGYAVASTNPTAATPTYTATAVAPSATVPLSPIACPTASFCIAVAGSSAYISQDPGAGVWSSGQQIDNGNALSAVACDPTVSLCVAVDQEGNAIATTNPTSTTPMWTSASIDGSLDLTGVSCPSTGLCVAVDSSGAVLTSANAGADTPTWTSQTIDNQNNLEAVSCAPVSTTCVAVGAGGSDNVFTTATPTSTWHAASIDAVRGRRLQQRQRPRFQRRRDCLAGLVKPRGNRREQQSDRDRLRPQFLRRGR
jgi:hypothetical protein